MASNAAEVSNSAQRIADWRILTSLTEIGAINNRTGTGHRQREEALTKGKHPYVHIQQTSEIQRENVLVALAAARQQEGIIIASMMKSTYRAGIMTLQDFFQCRPQYPES